MPTRLSEWGDALLVSLANALTLFLAAVPRILAFAVIVIIGWAIASLVAAAVAALLRAVNFNDLAQRSGFTGFLKQLGLRTDAAGAIAKTVKWFGRLITLVVGFDALNLPAVSELLQQLVMWLPNLAVALLVLVFGGLAANALARMVQAGAAKMGLRRPDLHARIVRIAVWSFMIVMALNQLGIATAVVNTLFMGVVAAMTLAAGLAFGLGGRETASEIVRKWYEEAQQATPRMERPEGQRQQLQPPSAGAMKRS
jgi:hypothetical protein